MKEVAADDDLASSHIRIDEDTPVDGFPIMQWHFNTVMVRSYLCCVMSGVRYVIIMSSGK